MMEHSIYSILSPEGFASILWKDAGLAAQAAEIMKLTPEALYELEVIDRIIPETIEGELLSKDQQLAALADLLETEFARLLVLDPVDRQQAKCARFRKF